MLELARHIEILLLKHDCVIVPGLGGFIAHHVEARYDHECGCFLPPLRTLGFNPQLNSLNDSILAQFYVEHMEISYPEAVRLIEEEVEELKNILKQEGRIELYSIGELYVNDEGHIAFTPCDSGILSPELYALNSFKFLTLENSFSSAQATEYFENLEQTAKEKQMPVSTETVEQSAAIVEEPATDEEEDIDDENREEIRIKLSWLRYTAAVAAAVIAFLLMPTPVVNSNHTLSLSPTETMFSLMDVVPTEKDAAQTTNDTLFIKENTEEKALAKNDTTAASIATNEEQANTTENVKESKEQVLDYCIVMASKVTQRNAEYFVNQLKNKGFESAQIYICRDIVRVIYGAYPDAEAAREALRKLRTENEDGLFDQSWIYRKQ